MKKETNLFSNFRNILIKNLEKFKYFFYFLSREPTTTKDKGAYAVPDSKERILSDITITKIPSRYNFKNYLIFFKNII